MRRSPGAMSKRGTARMSADLVLFLTTRGEYCTGQAFNLTGGREMH